MSSRAVRPTPSLHVKTKLRKILGPDTPNSLLDELAVTIDFVGKAAVEAWRAGVPFDEHEPDQLIEIRDAAKRLRRALKIRTYPDPKGKQGPTTTGSMAKLDGVAHDSAPEVWPRKTAFELPKILQILEDAADTLHEPRGAGRTVEIWRFVFGVGFTRFGGRFNYAA